MSRLAATHVLCSYGMKSSDSVSPLKTEISFLSCQKNSTRKHLQMHQKSRNLQTFSSTNESCYTVSCISHYLLTLDNFTWSHAFQTQQQYTKSKHDGCTFDVAIDRDHYFCSLIFILILQQMSYLVFRCLGVLTNEYWDEC